MVSPIATANEAIEDRDTRIHKLEKQVKAANYLIWAWDKYGVKQGCLNNDMNELFVKTDRYIKEYLS